jgi:hypothetical protein
VEGKVLKKYANNGECPGDGGREQLIPHKIFNLVATTGPLPNQRLQGGTDREYFRVWTVRGIVCEMYRDLLTGAWYLQRIYD